MLKALALVAALSTGPDPAYDQRQHLPAAVGVGQRHALILQRLPGACTQGRRAMLQDLHTMAMWLGCWTQSGGTVSVIFEDADSLKVPANEIHWIDLPAPARKPLGVM